MNNYTTSLPQADTICAIATAAGGAIGMVRVTGARALELADRVFVPVGAQQADGRPASLSERRGHTVTFGRIIDSHGAVLDEALATVFRSPHSYTGDDCVEFACHGSRYILEALMRRLIDLGCRQAERGEFTLRAYVNGKMDLAQAEAVADLVASSNEAAHRLAISQLRGGFSSELALLRERLLRLTSLIELELDFSDHEELEFADRSQLTALASEVESKVAALVRSFDMGNAIKHGIPVAIVGATNVGKSTLLNALLGEERAIVSDIHGTTRDTIEDTITINGIAFRFIDTAGIRHTTDTIEAIGIDRTFKKIEEARIVLWMKDARQKEEQTNDQQQRLTALTANKRLLTIYNKVDLCEANDNGSKANDSGSKTDGYLTTNHLPADAPTTLYISAKRPADIDRLKAILATDDYVSALNNNQVIVSSLRHHEALTHALAAIQRVKDGLQASLHSDLVCQDLRDCLHHLADITGGEITTDEVLSSIFSEFCIGK